MAAVPAATASAAVAAVLASGGTESTEFLNDIVSQLWPYINVAGSTMTKEIVEPMFADMLPGPLKSLHFDKIDLGKVPMRFANVDVHSRAENSIKLDIDVEWDGECDIELSASIIGSLGVEHVKLRGRLSVLMCPLVPVLPLIGAMQIAFINPPSIELDFTGAAQLADLSIIDNTVRRIISSIVAGLLVLPNRMLVKMDPANDYYKTYTPPLGYLRLTLVSGTGFKTAGSFIKDVPDLYTIVSFGANEPWESSTKDNDETPEWNESKDFLLSDHDQKIVLEVLDSDIGSDDVHGRAEVTVGELLLAGKSKSLPLIHEGKDTGASLSIKCDVLDLCADVTSFEAEENAGKDLMCGLLTVIVAGAKSIPESEGMGPNVKVEYDDLEFLTPTVMKMPGVDPRRPSFDCAFRVPLTSKMAANPSDITLTLQNHKDKLDKVVIKFADVVAAEGCSLKKTYTLENGAELDTCVIISGVKLQA